MKAFTAGELDRMRDTQEGAMMDTCLVLTLSPGGRNPYGEKIPTYQAGNPTPCGYNPKGGRDLMKEDKTIVKTDATLRLPLGTIVTPVDRIQITHLKGEALSTSIVMDVAGPIRRGPSGLVADLLKFEG